MSEAKIKEAPLLGQIEEIKIRNAGLYHLDNGVPIYEISGGKPPVLKMELIFEGGRWHEHHKAVAFFATKMLKEGTRSRKADEIATEIEFLGASLKVQSGMDFSIITVHCLNKHLETMLVLITDLLQNASFPQPEFKLLKSRTSQKLLIKKKRSEYLAQKKLHEEIFGPDHPYGYVTSKEHYDKVFVEDLHQYYGERLQTTDFKVLLSGKINENSRNLLNVHLGNLFFNGQPKTTNQFKELPGVGAKKVFVEMDDAAQSSIRMGRRLFNKKHPDYNGLKVLNMVLGGYFGSRLMKNIREEKGFTYGIYSGIHSFRHEGMFYIASEVGSEVREQAIDEIYREIDRLKNEPIPKKELELVRNYSLGRLLNMLDGPFSTSNMIKGLFLYDLDIDYFYNYVDVIKNISLTELQALAVKYLERDTLTEVTTGENNG